MEQQPPQQDDTEPSSSHRFGIRFSYRLSDSSSSRRLRFSLNDSNSNKNNSRSGSGGGRSSPSSAALFWRSNIEAEEMGLPVQDADFQFIDERAPSTIASGMDESVLMTASGRHLHQQQQLDAEDGQVVDNEVDDVEQVEQKEDLRIKDTEEEEGDGVVVVERVDGNNEDMEKKGDDEDDTIVSC